MEQRTAIIFGRSKSKIGNFIASSRPFFQKLFGRVSTRSSSLVEDIVDTTFDEWEHKLRDNGFIK